MNNEMSAEERDILDRFERRKLRSALGADREVKHGPSRLLAIRSTKTSE